MEQHLQQAPQESKKQGWTKERVIRLLSVNDFAVEQAILRLYERQTSTEQSIQGTMEKNGMGFSSFDGEIFSSFAEQIKRSQRAPGHRLSPKQLAVARKPSKTGLPRIARYAKQLLEVIQ